MSDVERRALRRARLALQIGGSCLLAAVGFLIGHFHAGYLDELAAHGAPRVTPLGIRLVWVVYLVVDLIFVAVAFARDADCLPFSSSELAAADEDHAPVYSPNGSHPGPAERGRPARVAPLAERG